MTCHNCGIPDYAISSKGFRTKLTFKAENKMRRDKHASVWCCSKACVVQAIALAEMGPTVRQWPISLEEFSRKVSPERYEDLSVSQ